MVEIKIGITILDKKENCVKTEPTMVGVGETFRMSMEIDEKSKDIVFDILCAPSLDGVAIYGIQNSLQENKIGILKEVEQNERIN